MGSVGAVSNGNVAVSKSRVGVSGVGGCINSIGGLYTTIKSPTLAGRNAKAQRRKKKEKKRFEHSGRKGQRRLNDHWLFFK